MHHSQTSPLNMASLARGTHPDWLIGHSQNGPCTTHMQDACLSTRCNCRQQSHSNIVSANIHTLKAITLEAVLIAPDGQEHGKGLPDFVIQAVVPDALHIHLIHLAQHLQCIALGHVTQHPHCQPRTCSSGFNLKSGITTKLGPTALDVVEGGGLLHLWPVITANPGPAPVRLGLQLASGHSTRLSQSLGLLQPM